MTDTLKKAKELIERFDGKITQGKWDVYVDDYVRNEIEPYNITAGMGVATKADIEAMSSVPQMLAIINELVEALTECQNMKPIFGIQSILDAKDNQIKDLKQRIAEIEFKE